MKLLLAVAFQILFGTLYSTAAVPCLGSYKVAVNESEPLYFRDPKAKKYIGVSQDLIDELSLRTTCKFTTLPLNRTRLISEMKSFRVDFIIVTVKNPVFDSIAKFISMETVSRAAFLSTESKGKHQTFSDLLKDTHLRFVVLPALSIFFTKEELERLTKERRFITAPSIQSAYDIIARTPNTVVVQADWIHRYFISSRNLSPQKYTLLVDPPKDFEIGIYYRGNISNPNDITAISQALRDFVADGTWKKIKDKYANYPGTK